MKIIIFTDLDGTLLDHENYSYASAMPALDRIKNEKIPLVMTTSKTRREVTVLQEEMGITDVFIAENGGGIFFPVKKYGGFSIKQSIIISSFRLIRHGMDYKEIRDFMNKYCDPGSIQGFGDMSIEVISDITGLSRGQASMAKDREFTEPFRLLKEIDFESLEKTALRMGIQITRGGRFYHFISASQDKGKAVKITADVFSENTGEEIITIGIGDSSNDLPMLQNVDIPVLIPHQDNRFEDFNLPHMRKAEQPGSKGWNIIVKEILDEFAGTGP